MVASHILKAHLVLKPFVLFSVSRQNGMGKLFWCQISVAICFFDNLRVFSCIRGTWWLISLPLAWQYIAVHYSSFVTEGKMPGPLCLIFYDILKFLMPKKLFELLSITSNSFHPLTSIVLLICFETWLFIIRCTSRVTTFAALLNRKRVAIELRTGDIFSIFTLASEILHTLKIIMCSTDLYKFTEMFSTSVFIQPERT